MRAWLLLACLSLKAALDMHCQMACKEDGELGGRWNAEEKACECSYIRLEKTPLPEGRLPKSEDD